MTDSTSSDSINVPEEPQVTTPMGDHQGDLALAAQQYIARGWALVPAHRVSADPLDAGVPACSCGRGSLCTSKGKHPTLAEWQQPAQWITLMSGAERARAVWSRRQPMNIGMVTGEPSGVWALDYDPGNADEHAAELVVRLRREGLLPAQETG